MQWPIYVQEKKQFFTHVKGKRFYHCAAQIYLGGNSSGKFPNILWAPAVLFFCLHYHPGNQGFSHFLQVLVPFANLLPYSVLLFSNQSRGQSYQLITYNIYFLLFYFAMFCKCSCRVWNEEFFTRGPFSIKLFFLIQSYQKALRNTNTISLYKIKLIQIICHFINYNIAVGYFSVKNM